jgi:hypothetical protein
MFTCGGDSGRESTCDVDEPVQAGIVPEDAHMGVDECHTRDPNVWIGQGEDFLDEFSCTFTDDVIQRCRSVHCSCSATPASNRCLMYSVSVVTTFLQV